MWSWNAVAGRTVNALVAPLDNTGLPGEEDSPTRLVVPPVAAGRPDYFQVSDDGLTATCIHPGGSSAPMLYGDAPAPTRLPVFYFEVTLTAGLPAADAAARRRGPSFALGFSPRASAATGWTDGSINLGNTGGVCATHGRGQPLQAYGVAFYTGDTIGVGLDWGRSEVFLSYAKSGEATARDMGRAAAIPTCGGSGDRPPLWPAICMSSRGQAVTVNFGARPFLFDLTARVAAASEACRAAAARAMVATGGAGPSTAITHSLVRDYLAFSGAATTLAMLDAVAPPPPCPSTSRLEASLAARSAARACLAVGDVPGAVAAALSTPGIPSPAAVLADPPAALFLACQATLEKLRAGDLAGGVAVARAALSSFILDSKRYRSSSRSSSRTGRGRSRAALLSANGLAPFLGLPSPLPGSDAIVPAAGMSDDEWTDYAPSGCDLLTSSSDDDDVLMASLDACHEAASGVEINAIAASTAFANDVLALAAYDLSRQPLTAAGPGAVTATGLKAGPHAAKREAIPGSARPADSVAAQVTLPSSVSAPPPHLAVLLSQAQREAAADALNASILATLEDGAAGEKKKEAPPRLAWPASRLELTLRQAAVSAAAVVETENEPVGPPFDLADFLPARPPGGLEADLEPIWGPPAAPVPIADAKAEVEVTSGVAAARGGGRPAKKHKAG